MNRFITIKFIAAIALCLTSCLGTDEAELVNEFLPPRVILDGANVASDNVNVTFSGSYDLKGTSTSVDECGFYYGTNPEFESAQKVAAATKSDKFSIEIPFTDYGTKYYYKAYISNGRTEVLTSVKSFQVPDFSFYVRLEAPSIVSSAAGDVTITSSYGIANGLSITEKGILYNSNKDDILTKGSKVVSSAENDITVDIKNLSTGSKYYMCSYVSDGKNIAYSEIAEFTSLSVPTLTTSEITGISSSEAVSGGNITSDGGANITSRGVVWRTIHNPTISLSTKTTDGTGSGSFVSSITGLKPGMTYYVRAYATNSQGTSYGNEVSFTTEAVKPSVTTSEATDITQSSATVGGNVTATGGADVTERGVVWNTSKNPTVDGNKKQSGNGSGAFTIELTDLDVATTYYVRAYATNSVGTSYGEEISFTTGSVKPTVTTALPSDVTSSSAISGGNVTSDGGKTVTARGVVYSTDHNPTISLSTKTTDGTGTGSFVSSITGLKPGMVYYVRAYATNAQGTSYGDEVSFTTSIELPKVATTSVSDITSKSAKSGGNVTYDGGSTITERGIVWGTDANPNLSCSNKLVCGNGNGSFTCSITNLTPNTTYYVRAYATNTKGSAYGEQMSFTTDAEGNTESVGNEEFEW